MAGHLIEAKGLGPRRATPWTVTWNFIGIMKIPGICRKNGYITYILPLTLW